MKRTAIGATAIPENIPYWSGGKNTDRLRISEKEIYSMIDLYQEICNYAEDDAIIQEYYGEMDKLYLALKLIEKFGDYPLFLTNAGIVFADLSGRGVFDATYSDLSSRNVAIDEIVQSAINQVDNTELPETYSVEILDWWQNIVVNQNYYVDLETGKQVKKPTLIAGMGATEYDEFAAKFKEGGSYYLYVAASATKVDTEKAFHKKQQQNYTIDRFETVGVGLTRSTMLNNINSGIISATGGKNANTALDLFKQGKNPGIGLSFVALIPLIVAALAAISGVAVSIVNLKKAKIDKETAAIFAKENLDAQAPSWSDFPGNDDYAINNNTGDVVNKKTGEVVANTTTDSASTVNDKVNKDEAKNGTSSISSYLPILLFGGAALLLLMD